MNYLCLAYYDEEKFAELSAEELEAIERQARAQDDALRNGGHLIAQGSLGSSSSIASIMPKGGKATVLDGPFAETKEQVGGFFILEARDLNEAIRVASRHPAAIMGEQVGWGLEIRPIETLEQL